MIRNQRDEGGTWEGGWLVLKKPEGHQPIRQVRKAAKVPVHVRAWGVPAPHVSSRRSGDSAALAHQCGCSFRLLHFGREVALWAPFSTVDDRLRRIETG